MTAPRWAQTPVPPYAAAEPHPPQDPHQGPDPRPRLHPSVAPLATLAAGIAASAYLYRTDPHEDGHWLPRCPFQWATGLLCPVCGGTRLAYDLLHGDPVRAFHENALLLLLSPVALWLGGRWLVAGIRGRRLRLRVSPRAQYALLVVGVGWAVARNLR